MTDKQPIIYMFPFLLTLHVGCQHFVTHCPHPSYPSSFHLPFIIFLYSKTKPPYKFYSRSHHVHISVNRSIPRKFITKKYSGKEKKNVVMHLFFLWKYSIYLCHMCLYLKKYSKKENSLFEPKLIHESLFSPNSQMRIRFVW